MQLIRRATGFCLSLAVLPLAPLVQAQSGQPQMSAAELDWVAREDLPADLAARLPSYCDGAYVAPSEGEPLPPAAQANPELVVARSNEARYDIDRQLSMQGNVSIRQGSYSAAAPAAYFDQQLGEIRLEGPTLSRSDGVTLTGGETTYDTESRNFQVNSATFLLRENHWRGEAEELRRSSESTLDIRSGRLTTCAPSEEDWTLVASEIRLDREAGFGTARHIRLEIEDVPVFYFPWASFPIDDRRKTGFLYPTLSTSSANSGLHLATPYYLNIAPQMDATVTPQYIHGRGWFTEAEGRYLSPLGPTVVQGGYIDEDDYYTEEPAGQRDRWAFNFNTRASLPYGWIGYGDFRAVSDEDYFSDLNQSVDFDREVYLRRTAGFRYDSLYQYADIYASGYQTLRESIPLASRPYYELPGALYGGRVELGVVETGLNAQYQYFDRDNEGVSGLARSNGQRLRVLPELALPLRAIWGYTRPSLTMDYTHYDLTDYPGIDPSIDRTIPVVEWDSGLYFDRRDSLFGIPYNQTLEPRLYYAWVPYEDQSDIPDFDTAPKGFSFNELFRSNRFVGGDRIGDTNQLTVALTSRINDLETGLERIRGSIGQIRYFDDRRVSLFGAGRSDDRSSSLAGELAAQPVQNLEVSVSGLWDPDTRSTEEGRTQMLYYSDDYRYLGLLGHTYSSSETGRALDQADVGAVFPLTDRVSFLGRMAYDLDNKEMTGSLAGLEYTTCCWNLQLVHQRFRTDEGDLDYRILFQIQLRGIGGTGRATNEFADALYGFRQREDRRWQY